MLDPYDMTERMYLVIKSIIDDHKKQEYEIKVHDIIKLGRVKFQVKAINNVINQRSIRRKNKRINRHRQGYAERINDERKECGKTQFEDNKHSS